MTMTVGNDSAAVEDRAAEKRPRRYGNALRSTCGAEVDLVDASVQDHRANPENPYVCVYMTAGTAGDDSTGLVWSITASTPAELLKLLGPVVERLEAMVEADLDGLA